MATHRTRHAEIGNFDDPLIAHEAVAGGEVAMHNALWRNRVKSLVSRMTHVTVAALQT